MRRLSWLFACLILASKVFGQRRQLEDKIITCSTVFHNNNGSTCFNVDIQVFTPFARASSTDVENSMNIVSLYLLSKFMYYIPIDILSLFPNVAELKIYTSQPQLTSLGKIFFKNSTNLKKIFIIGQQIRSLGPKSFIGAHNVTTLYLSSNKIEKIHENTFEGLTSCKYLDLSNNRIAFIEPETFSSITNLWSLRLRNNLLRGLSEQTFMNNSIVTLDLSYNQISFFTRNVVDNFIQSKDQYKLLGLRGNVCADKIFTKESKHVEILLKHCIHETKTEEINTETKLARDIIELREKLIELERENKLLEIENHDLKLQINGSSISDCSIEKCRFMVKDEFTQQRNLLKNLLPTIAQWKQRSDNLTKALLSFPEPMIRNKTEETCKETSSEDPNDKAIKHKLKDTLKIIYTLKEQNKNLTLYVDTLVTFMKEKLHDCKSLVLLENKTSTNGVPCFSETLALKQKLVMVEVDYMKCMKEAENRPSDIKECVKEIEETKEKLLIIGNEKESETLKNQICITENENLKEKLQSLETIDHNSENPQSDHSHECITNVTKLSEKITQIENESQECKNETLELKEKLEFIEEEYKECILEDDKLKISLSNETDLHHICIEENEDLEEKISILEEENKNCLKNDSEDGDELAIICEHESKLFKAKETSLKEEEEKYTNLKLTAYDCAINKMAPNCSKEVINLKILNSKLADETLFAQKEGFELKRTLRKCRYSLCTDCGQLSALIREIEEVIQVKKRESFIISKELDNCQTTGGEDPNCARVPQKLRNENKRLQRKMYDEELQNDKLKKEITNCESKKKCDSNSNKDLEDCLVRIQKLQTPSNQRFKDEEFEIATLKHEIADLKSLQEISDLKHDLAEVDHALIELDQKIATVSETMSQVVYEIVPLQKIMIVKDKADTAIGIILDIKEFYTNLFFGDEVFVTTVHEITDVIHESSEKRKIGEENPKFNILVQKDIAILRQIRSEQVKKFKRGETNLMHKISDILEELESSDDHEEFTDISDMLRTMNETIIKKDDLLRRRYDVMEQFIDDIEKSRNITINAGDETIIEEDMQRNTEDTTDFETSCSTCAECCNSDPEFQHKITALRIENLGLSQKLQIFTNSDYGDMDDLLMNLNTELTNKNHVIKVLTEGMKILQRESVTTENDRLSKTIEALQLREEVADCSTFREIDFIEEISQDNDEDIGMTDDEIADYCDKLKTITFNDFEKPLLKKAILRSVEQTASKLANVSSNAINAIVDKITIFYASLDQGETDIENILTKITQSLENPSRKSADMRHERNNEILQDVKSLSDKFSDQKERLNSFDRDVKREIENILRLVEGPGRKSILGVSDLLNGLNEVITMKNILLRNKYDDIEKLANEMESTRNEAVQVGVEIEFEKSEEIIDREFESIEDMIQFVEDHSEIDENEDDTHLDIGEQFESSGEAVESSADTLAEIIDLKLQVEFLEAFNKAQVLKSNINCNWNDTANCKEIDEMLLDLNMEIIKKDKTISKLAEAIKHLKKDTFDSVEIKDIETFELKENIADCNTYRQIDGIESAAEATDKDVEDKDKEILEIFDKLRRISEMENDNKMTENHFNYETSTNFNVITDFRKPLTSSDIGHKEDVSTADIERPLIPSNTNHEKEEDLRKPLTSLGYNNKESDPTADIQRPSTDSNLYQKENSLITDFRKPLTSSDINHKESVSTADLQRPPTASIDHQKENAFITDFRKPLTSSDIHHKETVLTPELQKPLTNSNLYQKENSLITDFRKPLTSSDINHKESVSTADFQRPPTDSSGHQKENALITDFRKPLTSSDINHKETVVTAEFQEQLTGSNLNQKENSLINDFRKPLTSSDINHKESVSTADFQRPPTDSSGHKKEEVFVTDFRKPLTSSDVHHKETVLSAEFQEPLTNSNLYQKENSLITDFRKPLTSSDVHPKESVSTADFQKPPKDSSAHQKEDAFINDFRKPLTISDIRHKESDLQEALRDSNLQQKENSLISDFRKPLTSSDIHYKIDDDNFRKPLIIDNNAPVNDYRKPLINEVPSHDTLSIDFRKPLIDGDHMYDDVSKNNFRKPLMDGDHMNDDVFKNNFRKPFIDAKDLRKKETYKRVKRNSEPVFSIPLRGDDFSTQYLTPPDFRNILTADDFPQQQRSPSDFRKPLTADDLSTQQQTPSDFRKPLTADDLSSQQRTPSDFRKPLTVDDLSSQQRTPSDFRKPLTADDLSSQQRTPSDFRKPLTADDLSSQQRTPSDFRKPLTADDLSTQQQTPSDFRKPLTADDLSTQQQTPSDFRKPLTADDLSSQQRTPSDFRKPLTADDLSTQQRTPSDFRKPLTADDLSSQQRTPSDFRKPLTADDLSSQQRTPSDFRKPLTADDLSSQQRTPSDFRKPLTADDLSTQQQTPSDFRKPLTVDDLSTQQQTPSDFRKPLTADDLSSQQRTPSDFRKPLTADDLSSQQRTPSDFRKPLTADDLSSQQRTPSDFRKPLTADDLSSQQRTPSDFRKPLTADDLSSQQRTPSDFRKPLTADDLSSQQPLPSDFRKPLTADDLTTQQPKPPDFYEPYATIIDLSTQHPKTSDLKNPLAGDDSKMEAHQLSSNSLSETIEKLMRLYKSLELGNNVISTTIHDITGILEHPSRRSLSIEGRQKLNIEVLDQVKSLNTVIDVQKEKVEQVDVQIRDEISAYLNQLETDGRRSNDGEVTGLFMDLNKAFNEKNDLLFKKYEKMDQLTEKMEEAREDAIEATIEVEEELNEEPSIEFEELDHMLDMVDGTDESEGPEVEQFETAVKGQLGRIIQLRTILKKSDDSCKKSVEEEAKKRADLRKKCEACRGTWSKVSGTIGSWFNKKSNCDFL